MNRRVLGLTHPLPWTLTKTGDSGVLPRDREIGYAALAETVQRGPRTRRTICSTCAIGVSGRMPWPRLKMSRPLA